MKAIINKDGCLVVKSENPTEEFALNTWLATNFDDNKGKFNVKNNLLIISDYREIGDEVADLYRKR